MIKSKLSSTHDPPHNKASGAEGPEVGCPLLAPPAPPMPPPAPQCPNPMPPDDYALVAITVPQATNATK